MVEDDSDSQDISLMQLRSFILNPVESTIRNHLGIFDYDYSDISMYMDEPFFSTFPFDYRFTTDVLENFVSGCSNDYLDKKYNYSALLGHTPDGAFRQVDRDIFNELIGERIEGGLDDFIKNFKGMSFYKNIVLGENPLSKPAGIVFKQPELDIPLDNTKKRVKLNSTIPFIWIDGRTGDAHTLVMTNSSEMKFENLVHPFLFYIICSSGISKDLKNFAGSRNFSIHVSYKKGTSSFTYCMEQKTCREYLNELVTGYLDKKNFDLLPFSIIASDKVLDPSMIKPPITADDSLFYRERIIQLVNKKIEDGEVLFRNQDLMSLIDLNVPDDAMQKTYKRLTPIFNPLKGEEE